MKYFRIILTCLTLLALGVELVGELPATQASVSAVDPPAWASPSVKTLKRIASVSGHQNEPVYLSNLDCELETYRFTDSATMQTGCFTDTAFGQMDADSGVVLFNGTDEGVHLLPYSPHQLLAPWPKALNLVSLVANTTEGSFISIYKNPLSQLQTQRNVLGAVVSKQLTAGPDLPLKDSTGQPLLINPQSLAFSDNGSWMIAEVLGGTFVRINLASLQITSFAPIYAQQGSPALDESAVTVSPDGRYVAIENTYASEFKVYDLANCSSGLCANYNYWPFISQQVSQLMYVSHVRFLNDGLLSFDASSHSSSAGGTYELAPTAGINSLIDYLGLGDSYSSGEGAFDYLAGTDTKDNRCHLSSHAYPILLTQDLFTAAGGHAVTCSGAVMHDISDGSDGYRGQVRDVASWKDLAQDQPALLASILSNYLPGYVAQQRFVSQYQPAVITLGIGGNNMGFGNILERCIEPQSSLHVVANTCFATYEDRQELLSLISKTGKGLQSTYKQLLKQAPATRLYVIGYPEVSIDNGDCALNVHFNTSELEFFDELVQQINGTIASAATAAGAQYVDISKALAGHRLCETNGGNIAVNGLTAGASSGLGDFDFIASESYHPNALGQQLIEQAILKQTHNLTALPQTITAKPPGGAFINAPKTGRSINQLLPSKLLSKSQASPGQTISLTIASTAFGLPQSGNYTVHLDGSQGIILGTLAGDSPASISIPITTGLGVHSIDITGTNQVGEPIDLTQPIIIVPPEGAGVCGPVATSGIDIDHDGIDDACDPVIGSSGGQGNPTIETGVAANSNLGTVISITPASLPASVTTGMAVVQSSAQRPAIEVVSAFTGGGDTGPTLLRLPARESGGVIRNVAPLLMPKLQNAKPQLHKYPIAARRNWPQLKIIPWLIWLIAGLVGLGCLQTADYWLRQWSRSKSLGAINST